MIELFGPNELEKILRDITEYWEKSKAPAREKTKILEMVAEYYETRALTEVDTVIANLTRSVLAQKQQLELFDETSE